MEDTDADEKVPPLKKSLLGSGYISDNILVVAGIGLALLAAFFPWYVFFNEDQFGFRPTGTITSRDLPENPARAVVNAVPSAIPDNDAGMAKNRSDTIITGTVAEEEPATSTPGEVNGEKPEDQPMPRDTSFRLLHVANGQAMIEYAGGIYLAKVGEVLPDDSRIATMEEREGRWVIVTDQGKVIAPVEE